MSAHGRRGSRAVRAGVATGVATLGVSGLALAGLGPAPTALAQAHPAAARPADAGQPAAAAAWRVVTSTRSAFLSALVAPSRRSIWALGTGTVSGQPQKGSPFGRHWNGRTWSRVSFPRAIASTGIGCAAESSATNVWAFAGTSSGGTGARAAGALRLVNGHWKLVKRFAPGIVTGCLVLDPTDVWVFGNANVAPGTGTWHLHGRTWTHLPTPALLLGDASAISKNDIWGEGESAALGAAVARWNGHSWVRNRQLAKALPSPGPNRVLFSDGITAISDRSVWLRVLDIRFTGPTEVDSYLVVHWDGRAWHHIGPANPGYYLPGAVRGGDGTRWSFLPADHFSPLPSGVRHLVGGRWVKVPVRIRGCLGQQPYLLAPAGTSSTMLGLQACRDGSHHVLARGSIR
jgi:hypothetical protein